MEINIQVRGDYVMMNRTDNMFWGDIKDVKRFTENTESNKTKRANKTVSIISAAIQLMENYIKGLKTLNAYDAASTIYSDANWIKNSTKNEFIDKNGERYNVEIGSVYYIDYGKTFSGELAYFHYGLCIGKRNGKILVVPITSGEDYFSDCFHPVNNPTKPRKYRQGLMTEGFAKNCVLMINDAKFISAGRIEAFNTKINDDALLDIQKLVFQVEFPDIYKEFEKNKKEIANMDKKISDQREVIVRIKNENNTMKQKLMKNNLL